MIQIDTVSTKVGSWLKGAYEWQLIAIGSVFGHQAEILDKCVLTHLGSPHLLFKDILSIYLYHAKL